MAMIARPPKIKFYIYFGKGLGSPGLFILDLLQPTPDEG
jgi:hypothetical protein